MPLDGESPTYPLGLTWFVRAELSCMIHLLYTQKMNVPLKTLISCFGILVSSSFLLQAQNHSISGDARKFKLAPAQSVTSSIGPTMDGGRLGVNCLIDGKLPESGWRSTWTAWMKKNPSLAFDLGAEKRIGVIRIYFHPGIGMMS